MAESIEGKFERLGDIRDKYPPSTLLLRGQYVLNLQNKIKELKEKIAQLEEERRWRKFPDEKPEHSGIFIVLIGKRTRTLDAYDTNKGKFQTYRPTAWMPLPMPPEEEQ